MPNELKHLSLSTRISILMGLIILVMMGTFSAFSLMKQEQESFRALTRNTLLLSQSTEKILRFSMLKNRRDEISNSLKDIVRERGILSARILNNNGVVKFASRQSEVDEQIPLTDRLCRNCHGGAEKPIAHKSTGYYSQYFDKAREVVYSSLPIYNSPGCFQSMCHSAETRSNTHAAGKSSPAIGTGSIHDSTQAILGFIEMEVSAQEVISDLDRTRCQLILLTVIIAVFSATMAYFSVNWLVGRPVRRLVEGTKRVAHGDFGQEIRPGKGEMGVLADSFNQMQRQLLLSQEELIESEKLASVGKIADQVANQINNPLTGILVFSEDLIDRENSNDQLKGDYQTILRQAMKIRESVRNILSLARRETPTFRSVDIAAVIKHTISVLERLVNFRNIQLLTHLPNTLPEVTVDPGLLEQVFLNLLIISSESMPSGGVTEISASHRREEATLEIRIDDTGEGIPSGALDLLSHGDKKMDLQTIDRTGVSLAVCKDIIALHKGTLSLASRPGRGTTITVVLPA